MIRISPIFILTLWLVSMLTATVTHSAPVRQEFRLTADVQKSFHSGSVEIEAGQTAFVSVYDRQQQTFPELMIAFNVKSPQSEVRDTYDLKLRNLAFECDYQPLAITAQLDGRVMSLGDVAPTQTYSESNSTHKWQPHQMRLIFPTIVENGAEQSCNGYIGIEVSLVI